ncbi:MAG: hypothetical protein WEE64_07360 [Dehalococcoidia bacterium]
MAIEDLMAVKDELPPQFVEAVLNSSSVRSASGASPKRRLPWLNSSLRRFMRGQADSICHLDLVPAYFRYSDDLSASERSSRFEYLLERHPRRDALDEAEIVVRTTYNPLYDKRPSINAAIQREARRQQDEILRRYTNAGCLVVDTEPKLFRNVNWLFERVALTKPPREIALHAGHGQPTVEKAVASLARELGIRLPRNRGPAVRR